MPKLMVCAAVPLNRTLCVPDAAKRCDDPPLVWVKFPCSLSTPSVSVPLVLPPPKVTSPATSNTSAAVVIVSSPLEVVVKVPETVTVLPFRVRLPLLPETVRLPVTMVAPARVMSAETVTFGSVPITVFPEPVRLTLPDPVMVVPASTLPDAVSVKVETSRLAPLSNHRSPTDWLVPRTGWFTEPAGTNTLSVAVGTPAGVQFDAVPQSVVPPSHNFVMPKGVPSASKLTGEPVRPLTAASTTFAPNTAPTCN